MSESLTALLCPARLIEVVDIGANPIDGDPPYLPILQKGLCRVTGFEPQVDALEDLLSKASSLERYLPYAIGDGGSHILNVCRASGMTSLLQPDPARLALFDFLRPLAEVETRVPLQTKRLDDVGEIENLDYLKIDIQGGELNVFRHGVQKLAKAVVVQVEVSFVPLYVDQPVFGDIDLELRAQGFLPHCFAAVKNWPIFPCVINDDPRAALNQLLEADIVYVRDFSRCETMSDEQLKHLSIIAHECYGSYDLALRCVAVLEGRGAMREGATEVYGEILQSL